MDIGCRNHKTCMLKFVFNIFLRPSRKCIEITGNDGIHDIIGYAFKDETCQVALLIRRQIRIVMQAIRPDFVLPQVRLGADHDALHLSHSSRWQNVFCVF